MGNFVEQIKSTPLEGVLLERIRRQGPMTFAGYMAVCLYEPGLGYYTSTGRKVGAEGDFYTSSNVHRVFGRLIARELCRMWESMGRPDCFQVVEPGAGSGRLAGDILDGLADICPEFYESVTYRLIEVEPSLAASQRELLATHKRRIARSEPAELADGRLRFTGCLLSNELLDSFPVHLVEMTPEGLREVYVDAAAEGFIEILGKPSTPKVADYFQHSGIVMEIGQRAEINLAALEWLGTVATALERGFVLTIDYGYLAPELYSAMRRKGSLLCYYRHTVEENPYLRPGLQDMTSHLDFSSLMEEGERLELRKVWFGEQYRFLMAAGLMEEMLSLESSAASEEERLKNRLALKKLMLPDGGMGDTFKVLIQAKGVENPSLLSQRQW